MIEQKRGNELNDAEYEQIGVSLQREFKLSPNPKEELADTTFFLLKQNQEILAMGGLKDVYPVTFDSQTYHLFGVVEVIANIKGKGYGKSVIETLRNYGHDRNISIIGFTALKNCGFYEKCGFNLTLNSTHRFIYQKDDQCITNQDGQVIFYADSSDKFMEKVLNSTNLDVILPTPALW